MSEVKFIVKAESFVEMYANVLGYVNAIEMNVLHDADVSWAHKKGEEQVEIFIETIVHNEEGTKLHEYIADYLDAILPDNISSNNIGTVLQELENYMDECLAIANKTVHENLGLNGKLHCGYHEADGSFSVFYTIDVKEAMAYRRKEGVNV